MEVRGLRGLVRSVAVDRLQLGADPAIPEPIEEESADLHLPTGDVGVTLDRDQLLGQGKDGGAACYPSAHFFEGASFVIRPASNASLATSRSLNF